jgi:hypothetical protein
MQFVCPPPKVVGSKTVTDPTAAMTTVPTAGPNGSVPHSATALVARPGPEHKVLNVEATGVTTSGVPAGKGTTVWEAPLAKMMLSVDVVAADAGVEATMSAPPMLRNRGSATNTPFLARRCRNERDRRAVRGTMDLSFLRLPHQKEHFGAHGLTSAMGCLRSGSGAGWPLWL